MPKNLSITQLNSTGAFIDQKQQLNDGTEKNLVHIDIFFVTKDKPACKKFRNKEWVISQKHYIFEANRI